VIGVTLI